MLAVTLGSALHLPDRIPVDTLLFEETVVLIDGCPEQVKITVRGIVVINCRILNARTQDKGNAQNQQNPLPCVHSPTYEKMPDFKDMEGVVFYIVVQLQFC